VTPGGGKKAVLFSEGTVADAFAREYRGRLLFDHTRGKWFLWDGARWRREETKLAYRWAHEWARRLARGQRANVAVSSGKAAFAAGVERLAQAERVFAVTHEVWDADPWLLGTPGGVVDLRTGVIRPAAAEDRITRLTAVAPSETADCPLWLGFLNEAAGGDAALVGFLQRWFGYCLAGVTEEHALVFVHGDGGNGKGVMMNTLFRIVGDYAANAAVDSFVVTGRKDGSRR
jgi:putative DNA primase/helicase